MIKDYWWLSKESQDMLNRGYLKDGISVDERLNQICEHASSFYKGKEDVFPNLKERFKELFVKGFCSLSSPIWANFGTDRGLPIACFNSYIPDSLDGIYSSLSEVAIMTQKGGGTSGYFGKLRPFGSKIKDGGVSSGMMSFLQLFDTTTKVVSQGNTRRGAFAAYLDIEHPEIKEFLNIKDRTHDMQTINFAVNVSDSFMKSLEDGHKENRELWSLIIKSRREKGVPYINFIDTINKNKPQIYKDAKSDINSSNLCLDGDTYVMTDKGYFTASELHEMSLEDPDGFGELVLFDGNKPVKATAMHLIERDANVCRVVLNNQYEMIATPSHGIMSIDSKTGKPVKIEIQDAKIGTKIVVQSKKGLFPTNNNYGFTQSQSYVAGIVKSYMRFRYKIKFSDYVLKDESEKVKKHLCNLLGIKHNSVDFDELRTIVDEYTLQQWLVNSQNKPSLSFTDGFYEVPVEESNPLNDLLADCMFDVPKGKILKSTLESQLAYFEAILEFNEMERVAYSDSSELGMSDYFIHSEDFDILECFSLLCANLGHVVTLRRYKSDRFKVSTKSKKAVLFFLSLSKNEDFEQNTIRLAKEFKEPNVPEYLTSTVAVYEGKNSRSLKPRDVYCLTVDTDEHLFVANGILTYNCNEIHLPTNELESFVCCLMSMNLSTYDHWKDTDSVELAVLFLDSVMQDFIDKTKNMNGMIRANLFARNHRALGIGVMGWHSLLQQRMIPFESFEAQMLNTSIFKMLKERTLKSSVNLGKEMGVAPIFKDNKTTDIHRRNTTLLAVAPTTSSASILGQVSPSIEPFNSNYFVVGLANGSFSRKNRELEKLLEKKGKNTQPVWESIMLNKGSVSSLEFLTKEEKEVFKTFNEISPLNIVQQASARQKFIDQGQSLNLKIPSEMSPKDINSIHMEAWRQGVKGLYYQRGTSVSKETLLEMMNCKSCEA